MQTYRVVYFGENKFDSFGGFGFGSFTTGKRKGEKFTLKQIEDWEHVLAKEYGYEKVVIINYYQYYED